MFMPTTQSTDPVSETVTNEKYIVINLQVHSGVQTLQEVWPQRPKTLEDEYCHRPADINISDEPDGA